MMWIKMAEAVKWIAVSIAVSVAIYVTGNWKLLWFFLIPMLSCMPGYAGAVFNAISPALKAAMPAAQKKARRQIDVLTRAKERLMELMEEPQK